MNQYFQGDGVYNDVRTWKLTDVGVELKIEPRGIPYLSLTIALIFLGVIGVWGSQFGEGKSLARVLFIIGIFLCATVFLVASYSRYVKQLRLGPWLILNRATGIVTLPRSSFSISLSDIDRIGVALISR